MYDANLRVGCIGQNHMDKIASIVLSTIAGVSTISQCDSWCYVEKTRARGEKA